MALSKILPASQEQFAGARNLIINGAMQVAQRGTSFTGLGAGTSYQLDRWQFNEAGTSDARFTVTQSTDAPDGFSNSYKVDVTTADTGLAATEAHRVRHRFEGQNLQHLKFGTSNALKLTLSFWVKSNKTGQYSCMLYNQDPSTARKNFKGYTIDTADTWEFKSITFEADTNSDATFDNDNASSLIAWWNLSAGSSLLASETTGWVTTATVEAVTNQVNLADSTSNEWYITGVQLEVGETASDFEHRSYGDELARCMRYYEKSYKDSVYFLNGSSGTQIQRQTNRFMVQKRASPTLTQTKTAGSSGSTVGNVGGDIDGIMHSFGGGDIESCFFSWTADAEL